jgi:hypothetical protein
MTPWFNPEGQGVCQRRPNFVSQQHLAADLRKYLTCINFDTAASVAAGFRGSEVGPRLPSGDTFLFGERQKTGENRRPGH